jgi:hypothetical protein
MRYNIMVQLVAGMTLILLGTAALIAWIQTRSEPVNLRGDTSSSLFRDGD